MTVTALRPDSAHPALQQETIAPGPMQRNVAPGLAYRPDIDGLRAIAILSVLLFHAFPQAMPGGFVGVDVFFVISGYLISSILLRRVGDGTLSLKDFYARRIARIFPALLIVLIATYAIGWFLLPADEYNRLATHILGGAGFYSNVIYLKESGYFDALASSKPLLHLWSLAIEEQFYLVWPALIWGAWRLRVNVMWMIAVLGGLSFLLNLRALHLGDGTALAYYAPQTRFWELALGSALAMLSMQRCALEWRDAGPRGNLLATLGLGLIGASFLLISKSAAFPGWWALLPTGGAALVIFGGPRAWVNRTLLGAAVPVWIGKISFALYLWHWPLLSFAQMASGGSLSTAARIGVLAVSVVLAWGTHVLIENPIRFGAHRVKIPLLIAAMLLMAGIAGVTVKGDGLSLRYGTVELKREPGRFECEDRKKNSGCVFGNPHADKLIVVVGDSHAEHLTKALNEALGRDYRFIMVTNGACFMGTKIFHPEIGNLKDCTAANDRLASLKGRHVYAVIRSQRWHAYGADSPAGITALVQDAILAGGLQPEKIIIVGSTANVPFDCDVANYYAMPLSAKQTCTAKRDYKDLNRMFIATTRAMQVPDNVHFVYPYDHLCPHDVCTVIRGNVANYSDTHHMTVDGARQVIPDIARALGPPSPQPSPGTTGKAGSGMDRNSL